MLHLADNRRVQASINPCGLPLARFRDGEHICFTDRLKRINDDTIENGFLDVNPI